MPAGTVRRRIAVLGGGWAGIAAAVEATARGHAVELFEMAPQLGGRARSFEVDGIEIDNGQHIAIGAYVQTLALMRRVGVDPQQAFERMPLRLVDANGVGLRLRSGPPASSFGAAVLAHPGWSWRDKVGLLAATASWALHRFRCDASLSVDRLCARIGQSVHDELIAPLCVAALNTPSHEASAAVFLRVLRDALFGGPGASDLLLPRVPLSRLLASPARAWLLSAGAQVHSGRRVLTLEARDGHWSVDGCEADAVVLATSSIEAARLTQAAAPDWSRVAAALTHEPIVTVYAYATRGALAQAMLTLPAGNHDAAPAQFVFDRGRLGGPDGMLAFVISGARDWVGRGPAALWQAVEMQAGQHLGEAGRDLRLFKIVTEQRATFRCVPGLVRPAQAVAPGLVAAADYVAGPYPATLEGAVRSGQQAIDALDADARREHSPAIASRKIRA